MKDNSIVDVEWRWGKILVDLVIIVENTSRHGVELENGRRGQDSEAGVSRSSTLMAIYGSGSYGSF